MPRVPGSVLERSLQAIFHLSEHAEPLALSEIAAAMGVNKSTAFRILEVLRRYHLVNRHQGRGGYSLGHAFLQLADRYRENFPLVDIAMPSVRRLRDETKESVGLYIREDGNRVCVARADSREIVKRTLEVGISSPLYLGAAGKVLATVLDSDELIEMIGSDQTKIPRAANAIGVEQILAELDEIRLRGYAVSQEETARDVWAIAVPVTTDGSSPDILAALAVSGPMSRFPKHRIMEIVEKTKAAAEAIRAQL